MLGTADPRSSLSASGSVNVGPLLRLGPNAAGHYTSSRRGSRRSVSDVKRYYSRDHCPAVSAHHRPDISADLYRAGPLYCVTSLYLWSNFQSRVPLVSTCAYEVGDACSSSPGSIEAVECIDDTSIRDQGDWVWQSNCGSTLQLYRAGGAVQFRRWP